jgi:alkaline phosphatase D
MVLWTRLVGLDPQAWPVVPVRWEVLEDRAGGPVVASGEVLSQAVLGHTVHAEPVGLSPNRWYRYRFTAGGARSPEGRTRTLPSPDAQTTQFRLAYASCQRWEDGHYAAYRHMAQDTPDLVLFLGDYIYEYASRKGPSVRGHTLPHIKDLAGYRQRYALYRSDPLLQQMHAACPWLVTWDDHEVENNYAGPLSTMGTDNLPALRLAAYQAFYENMPIPRAAAVGGLQGLLSGQPLQVHTMVDVGRLARLYLLDNRQYRSRPACGTAVADRARSVCALTPEPDRSMLGLDQERWLWAGFQGAQAQGTRWNVLAQQTRFTPADYPKGVNGQPAADSWDGYPETRQRLLDALQRERVQNPVILGGDIHQNWVARVHADPFDVASPVVASEFCGTSLTSNHGATTQQSERLRQRNPHCLLANAQQRGYGLVDLAPQQLVVTLRVVDDVARADSPVSTLARFEVPNGRGVQATAGR